MKSETKSYQWTTIKELAPNYDHFLLDCDGVVWSGGHEIDKAFEVVQWLESLGKQVFFISNSSGRTREDMVEKMQKFGYKNARPEQMYGSAYIVSQYLKENYPEINKVRVVGMDSIKKELEKVGISSIGGEDHEEFEGRHITLDEFENYKIDPEVKAVIVGLDTKFTYTKLSLASLYINTGKAKFIACNDDAFDMVQGRKQPGAGAMVESILVTLNNEEGSQEMRRPEVVGKPNPYVVHSIAKDHNITDFKRMIMIGDRPDTDIFLGSNSGIDKCLVMTGVVEMESHIENWIMKDERFTPTYVMKSVGILD